MGLVAARALGLARVKRAIGACFFMTLRATERDLRDATRMWLMAPDAVSLLLRRMRRRHILVAALAHAATRGSNRMRLMTAVAVAMRLRDVLSKHTYPLMAGVASSGRRGRKRMRLMAADTRFVPASESCGRWDDRFFVPVAIHARRGLRSELVPSVAIRAGSAQLGPPVLDVHLVVALATFADGLGGRPVRIVARLAGHRGVHGEAVFDQLALERPVATGAMPSPEDLRLGAEYVARVAVHGHPIGADVRQIGLLFVTLGAHARIGRIEDWLGRIVAFVAVHRFVDDVLRMAWRETHLRPVVRHGSGVERPPLLLDRRDHFLGELCVEESACKPEDGKNGDDDYGPLHRPPT
ncbi:MAG: hypothetical protein AMS21_01465 [Gemmatimonas sp. SG8_38_2]|nr:MAG: hypothetical protein AMS21_01465 [Gemmatimonas sp. SG8_38_2]